LRIGGKYLGDNVPPDLPFRGLLDDIQDFGQGLNGDEVMQMNEAGIWTP
jgi:hypothetical protein